MLSRFSARPLRLAALPGAALALACLGAAAPLVLYGCGGGRGIPAHNLPNSTTNLSYAGAYDGTWSVPELNQGGRAAVLVAPGGDISGVLIDEATGQIGNVDGLAGLDGKVVFTVAYPGQEKIPLRGAVAAGGSGLVGEFNQKINDREYRGVLILALVQAATAPTPGGGDDGGAIITDRGRVTAICNNGELSYSPNCSGTCSQNGGIARSFIGCGEQE